MTVFKLTAIVLLSLFLSVLLLLWVLLSIKANKDDDELTGY